MRCWRLLPLAVLLAVLVPARGNFDDFDLQDAFGNYYALANFGSYYVVQAQKIGCDFEIQLEEIFAAVAFKRNGRFLSMSFLCFNRAVKLELFHLNNFDDLDLIDGSLPKGGSDGSGSNERRDPGPNSGEETESSQGAIAGIVSAVVATVIGAVSSFIAYQKKKLCFKQSDEENVNMESHRGAQSEPPVQRTLLEN
ncbi:CD99 antigen [Aegotheles albertisi]